MNIIKYDVKIPVKVRKYEVDKDNLVECLRSHKGKLSNRKIAEHLNIALTEVEHWFRKDQSFSVPRPELWYKIKNLLNIQTKEFDESVMTFIEKPGVYDQANRVYDIEGIAPTLTATGNVLVLGEMKNEYEPKEIEYMEPNGLKMVDLFCGAGGMGLGFEQAGFDIVYALDFDKYAVQSYNENMKTPAIQGDITEIKGNDIPLSDVWTFGFPCQDLSVAGKQAGLFEGKRSNLFFHVMRLLDEVEHKPKMILAENVKGLRKYLPTLEVEYEKAGYKMIYQLYNSKYWDVPQNRERYFVCGIRDDLDINFEFPEEQHDFVPKLSSILESEVDEKFYIDNEKAKKIIEQAKERVELKGNHATLTVNRTEKRQNGRRSKEEEEPMYTLSTQDQHGLIQLGMLDMKGQDNIRRVYDPKGISPTLTTSEGGHRQPKVLIPAPIMEDGSAYTVTTRTHAQPVIHVIDRKQGHFVFEKEEEMDWKVRKLTPREYARLQGFPDDWKFVCSNSQLYKQFGNAVTVNVANAIAKKIGEVLNGTK